ncbi:MAG TPA: restriction endonuclease subunit S [Ruminococcus bromii]|nr:restriction endonuclease subunit S [Ruminococcus bromii]HJI65204.1 restriction endonuclease subunit S [Ruminococcus bromii]
MQYSFSELIEEVNEKNTSLKYGIEDIVGVTIEKGIIPTIANLSQTALDKFYIVKPGTFIYNPRTHGVRIGMGYNDTECTYITSWNNVAFKVKEEAKQIVNPMYLWMYFLRSEWDRETNYYAMGSSTIVFLWSTFQKLKIELPSIEKQNIIVRQYEVLQNRIQLKKQINDNLEATLGTLYKEYFSFDKGSELPSGWQIAPFSKIATVVMGQSPEGDDCNNDGIGEPLLNGPTEFGFYSPTPAQWTTNGKKYCDNGDILFCVRGSTTGRMNWANQRYVIGRGLAAIRHISDTNLNWFIKAIIDNSLQEILSAATGSTFPNVGKDLLNNFQIVVPDTSTLEKFGEKGYTISQLISQNAKEIDHLLVLQRMLLSQLAI